MRAYSVIEHMDMPIRLYTRSHIRLGSRSGCVDMNTMNAIKKLIRSTVVQA